MKESCWLKNGGNRFWRIINSCPGMVRMYRNGLFMCQTHLINVNKYNVYYTAVSPDTHKHTLLILLLSQNGCIPSLAVSSNHLRTMKSKARQRITLKFMQVSALVLWSIDMTWALKKHSLITACKSLEALLSHREKSRIKQWFIYFCQNT